MKSRPSRLQGVCAAALDSQGHALDLEQRWSFRLSQRQRLLNEQKIELRVQGDPESAYNNVF